MSLLRRLSLHASVALALAVFAGCGGQTSDGGGAGGNAGGAQGGAGGASGGGGGASGKGGASGASGASGSWSACTGPGTCVLDGKGCCGACDATVADVDGVARGHETEHRTLVCPNGATCGPCQDGYPGESQLAAFCTAGSCTPIDVRTDDVSACATDTDCLFRGPGCCQACVISESQIIALSQSGNTKYQKEVCPPEPIGCPACAPIYPPGTHAVCGADKHCTVVVPQSCPVTTPYTGQLCNLPDGSVCEYGQDILLACRIKAICTGGAYQVTSPFCPSLPGPGEMGCPTTAAASGSDCTPDGLVCDLHAGTTCLCTQCAGGPCSVTPHWDCSTPPGNGCPTFPPDLGQACDVPGVTCGYGTCGGPNSALRACDGGVWVAVPQACPV